MAAQAVTAHCATLRIRLQAESCPVKLGMPKFSKKCLADPIYEKIYSHDSAPVLCSIEPRLSSRALYVYIYGRGAQERSGVDGYRDGSGNGGTLHIKH